MNHHRAEHARAGVGELAIARAPDHIRRGINARRVASGLAPVMGDRDRRRIDRALAAMEDVCYGRVIRDELGLPPRKGDPGRRGKVAAPAAVRSTITRIIVVPAYGVATARSIGERWHEHIAPGAFGTAAALNAREGEWQLTRGHDGPVLEAAGQRLRAVDSELGPLLCWEPVYSDATFEVVRHMTANGGRCAASCEFRAIDRRPSRFEPGALLVHRARLDGVALLTDPRQVPAYKGALALMRTNQRRNDPAALRDHIKAAVAAARAASR